MAGEAWTMMETDLGISVEGDFAAPVTLVTPDGITINTSLHGGALYGKVQYDFREESPGGEIIIVNQPLVVLRLSSLSRIPKAGEKWLVYIPTSPSDPTPHMFVLGATRAPKLMATIGVIRLYPQQAEQA